MLLKPNRSFMPNQSLNPNQSLDHKSVTGKGKLEADGSFFPVQHTVAKVHHEKLWVFLSFSHPSRARVRAHYSNFALFAFTTFTEILVKYWRTTHYEGFLGCKSRFSRKTEEKWWKNASKMERKIWRVFQKVSDQHRKNIREIWKNLRRFLEKLQRFSRNLLRFFWNVGDIIPIWKVWLREARCEGCESKKCKIPGKARASHAWGKTSMKGGKMEQKRPAISSDKVRKEIRKSCSKIYDICKVNKAISPAHKEKTALFRRFLSLCLIWHPYSIEEDEIEKQQKKCS